MTIQPQISGPQPGELWKNDVNTVRVVTVAHQNSSGWEIVVYDVGDPIPFYTDLDDFMERFTKVAEKNQAPCACLRHEPSGVCQARRCNCDCHAGKGSK